MKSLLTVVAVVSVFGASMGSILGAQERPDANKRRWEAKSFQGVWVGTMTSPVVDPFPVEIEIGEFAVGKWCAVLKHAPPIDAEGKMLGIKLEGKAMTVAQTIFKGRERCYDGMNVLTLIDENTIKREWIDPETGKVRDTGTLKRR